MLRFCSKCTAVFLAVALLASADMARAQRAKTTKLAGWNQTCFEDSNGRVIRCRLVKRFQLTSGPAHGGKVGFQVRRSRTEEPFIRVQVPANVDLQSGVSVAVMDGRSTLSTIAYRSRLDNCTAAACFAKLPLDDELLAALKTNKVVQIGFADAEEEKVNVAVPLKGFGHAYDLLDAALK